MSFDSGVQLSAQMIEQITVTRESIVKSHHSESVILRLFCRNCTKYGHVVVVVALPGCPWGCPAMSADQGKYLVPPPKSREMVF